MLSEDNHNGKTDRELLYNSDISHVFEWQSSNPHKILREIRHRIPTREETTDAELIEYKPTSVNDQPLNIESNGFKKTGIVHGELKYEGERTHFSTETLNPNEGRPELLRLIGSIFGGVLSLLITLMGAIFTIVGGGHLLGYMGRGSYELLKQSTKLGSGLSVSEATLTGAVLTVLGIALCWFAYHVVKHHYNEWDYVTSERPRKWYLKPETTIKFDGEVGHTSAYDGEMKSNKSVLSGGFEVIIGENVRIEAEERGTVIQKKRLQEIQQHEMQSAIGEVYDPLIWHLDIEDKVKYADMPRFLHTMK